MPPKKQDTQDQPKAKGLFDHINAIYENQKIDYFENITDADKKSYSNYMVNRFLSMNPHQLPIVNELQKYNLTSDVHYKFYSQALPRKRQFNKYIKKTKEVKYEDWLIDIIVKHYHVSIAEAETYLEIYYIQNKLALRQLCEMYGITDKELKKAKL